MSESEMQKFDGGLRAVLSSMNLSKAFGGELAEQALRDAKTYGQLNDKGKAAWDLEQTALLASAVGHENVEEAVKNAGALLSIAKDANPESFARLEKMGAWRSAQVVARLHMQVQLMSRRSELGDRRGKE